MVILYFMGTHPTKKEWLGVVLAIVGCFCMIFDPKARRADGQDASVTAAIIDIGSAIFGAFYFLLSARNVKNIPICLLIFVMNFHTFIINSCVAKFQDNEIKIISFDPKFGCLGFLNVGN